jgi:NDP-sugar pyrophosphorylase family protein
MAFENQIASTAHYDPNTLQMGPGASLAHGVYIGKRVTLGAGTVVEQDVHIDNDTYTQSGVYIGQGVEIYGNALILRGAMICQNNVYTHSSNARQIYAGAIIGPNVQLHDEVELGEDAIIPTQQTIAHFGFLGDKYRVITMYGSDEGPRYSIGCRIGFLYPDIKDHIVNALGTDSKSAAQYVPFLGSLESIGIALQHAYMAESPRIDELKAMHKELVLDPQDRAARIGRV